MPAPDVVVFAHDTDGDEGQRAQMRQGIERARVEGMPFALAIAHQESEAWVVAGFVAEHKGRRGPCCARSEAEHGFAPTAEPHRLTPKRSERPARRQAGLRLVVP